MTNIWMLSKQSMKGLDLLDVTADILSAHESQKEKITYPESKFKEAVKRSSDLLKKFIETAEAQISRSHPKDIFIQNITEELEKNLSLPPSKLIERLEKSVRELEQEKISSDTAYIFEVLSDIIMKITSRSVDVLSTPVY